jgi:hypothetical protein
MLTGDTDDGAVRRRAEDTPDGGVRPRAEPDTSDRNFRCDRSFRLQAERNPAIRELTRERRRSRIPWIYVVYQVKKSALPAQKRRHVQGRLELEVASVLV